MNVSFNGFNENSVTFEADSNVTVGAPVKMCGNGKVSACADGEVFCGIATDVRGDYATVQIAGYVTANYSGSAPTVGYTAISAGADGAVSANENGRTYLVTDVDTTASTVGFML